MTPPSILSPSRREFLKLSTTAGAAAIALGTLGQLPLIGQACRVNQELPPSIPPQGAPLVAKDFSDVPARNSKLSKSQLAQHIALYNGYVSKLNAANKKLTYANASGNMDHIRDTQLARSYSHDGAILHDYYFSNLGEDQPTVGELTGQLLERDFGSMDRYYADLLAVGNKMRGWVITGYSHLDNRVYNYGLDAHDAGFPGMVCPLVVLDVYEHAYMIDFGTKRSDYLDVFKNAIRWNEVEQRTHHALKLANLRSQEAINCAR